MTPTTLAPAQVHAIQQLSHQENVKLLLLFLAVLFAVVTITSITRRLP